MLPLLPVLGCGESVLGIAARLHRLAGLLRYQDTLHAVFGTRNAKPANMLPSHLQWMVKQLEYPDSVTDFIETHTALPYFKRFVTPTIYTRAMDAMAGPNAGGCKLSLGLLASRLGGSNRLAFCPACAKQDFQRIGIATWHRDVQLPGVLVCAEHYLPLVGLPTRLLQRHPYRLPLPEDIGDLCQPETEGTCAQATLERLCQIAKMSSELLGAEPIPVRSPLRWHYAAWLLQAGLAKQSAYIDQQVLAKALTTYWQPLSSIPPFDRLLSDLQRTEGHWLATLCRHQRAAHHPLKHLLLMGFLARSIEEFFSLAPVEPARASNPTPALTPSRDERLAQLSRLLEQEPISLRQAACKLGLSLQTVQTLALKLHVPVPRRPKKFDARKRSQLLTALLEPRSLVEIARDHHASMSTLCRILAAYPDAKRVREKRLFLSQRVAYRANLRHIRHRNKASSWQQLRNRAPAACAWLTRHDHIWLDRFRQTLAHPLTHRRHAIDWNSRDLTMINALEAAILTLQTISDKPRRISLASLSEFVEHPDWLDKQLNHLPLTRDFLSKYLESIPAFQQRRLDWYRKKYEEEVGNDPPSWLLRRQAGLP
ncbi:TnsD family transposase [Craterilacuibacter sp. RT1T]|uniref:TnsD family transposase n=1 Tax=Craterilacuibacter sp. RT1T TaxID=2942211 RepID=UPI0020BE2D41|nr:TnsD family transposase [Craterilacuibacter sp. RT1T]MCL6264525.1 TnsD family transposase [Craterilacuibacter sp. RT1T]